MRNEYTAAQAAEAYRQKQEGVPFSGIMLDGQLLSKSTAHALVKRHAALLQGAPEVGQDLSKVVTGGIKRVHIVPYGDVEHINLNNLKPAEAVIEFTETDPTIDDLPPAPTVPRKSAFDKAVTVGLIGIGLIVAAITCANYFFVFSIVVGGIAAVAIAFMLESGFWVVNIMRQRDDVARQYGDEKYYYFNLAMFAIRFFANMAGFFDHAHHNGTEVGRMLFATSGGYWSYIGVSMFLAAIVTCFDILFVQISIKRL